MSVTILISSRADRSNHVVRPWGGDKQGGGEAETGVKRARTTHNASVNCGHSQNNEPVVNKLHRCTSRFPHLM